MSTVNDSTLFIHVSDQAYPVSLGQIRQVAFQGIPSITLPPAPTEAQVNSLGYAVVTPVAQPTGDVVTEGAPVNVAGVWNQVWDVRSFTAAEVATNLQNAQAAAEAAINTARDNTFNGNGMNYTFPDNSTGHIQMRETDRINLLTLQAQASALIAQNITSAVMPFRSLENVTYMLTPVQCQTMCNAVTQYGTQIYQAAWNLKAQVDAATTIADIPAVPDTLTP